MSYRDPYSDQYGTGGRYQNQPQVNESTPDYTNPYTQPHQTYDQGGYDAYDPNSYRDQHRHPDETTVIGANGSGYPPLQRGQSQRTVLTRGNTGLGLRDEGFGGHRKENSFTAGEYAYPKERTVRGLKDYRYDHQGNLWTKGGRGRCIGRFCCCTLMIAVLLIVSIVLALALWIRPPGVQLGDVQPVSKAGSQIQIQPDGVTINLGLNISVDNPNYFSINIKNIQADLIYPINNTPIGGGSLSNVVFKSGENTNITFPFAVNYKTSADPGGKILSDLATKCGSKSDVTVNYKITVGIRILFVTASPVIQNKFSFPCPLNADDLKGLLQSMGISSPGG